MSKLLRLSLALLAASALFLLSPGIAAADLPSNLTASDCLASPDTDGCRDLLGYDDPGAAGQAGDQPASLAAEGATEQPQQRAGLTAELSQQAVTSPVCEQYPDLPICDDSTEPPTVPPGDLTCDDLADLLGIPGGCPDSFTCQDLADLLGLTCPEGPPDCAALAAMLGLPVDRCPEEPPGSCEEFAALLGLEGGCSDIPCLDISQVPAEAREGLKPLLDALEQIGVTACPAKTTPPPADNGGTGTGGGTTAVPPPASQVSPQPVATTPQAVSHTQPSGKLAYTGVDVEGLVRLAAILVSGGTLILLAGVRRA